MDKKKILFLLLLLTIVVVVFRHDIIYRISLWYSGQKDEYLFTRDGMYVHIDDKSGPANMLRFNRKWEPWMDDYINKYCSKDKCSVDIGAHIGIHTVTMAKKSNKVYAFEPNTKTLNTLNKNVTGYSNVIVYPYAVGNENGVVQFVENEISSLSSVSNGVVKNSVPVQMVRLDDTIMDEIDFIKIDAEGGEMEIFKGMDKIIKKYMPVIVYEDNSFSKKNNQYLKSKYGYKIQKIGRTDFIATKA